MRSVLTSSRGFVLIAVLALVVGACGTTTSPSPAAASPDDASPSAAPSSPASASPDQSQSPGASPSAPASSPSASGSASAGEGPDLGGAAEGLEDLTSYQLDMEVAGVVPPALASGGSGSVQMQALVDSESEAVQFSMSGAGVPGGATTLRVIVIGDDAWVDPGTGTYIAQAGNAAAYQGIFERLSPEVLLQQVPAGGVAGAERVGEEEKNGAPTIHYIAEGSSSPEMEESLGADSVLHLWVSRDRGHLVSMSMQGTTEVEGENTAIDMSMDISRVNDPAIDIRPPGR